MLSLISADVCRKHAKSLHRDVCAGQPEAIERIRRSHPFFRGKNDQEIKAKITRRTAQKALARENGFADWEALLEATELQNQPAGAGIRPSLAFYECQVHALMKDLGRETPEAQARVRAAKVVSTDRCWQAAYETIAKENGFDSFDSLEAEIAKAAAARGGASYDAELFLERACLRYRGNEVHNPERAAREILAKRPDIVEHSIYTAAAAGATEVVAAFLDANPALVKAKGGVREWEPILYACYSRVNSRAAGHDTLETVRLLLDRGADPNAFYYHELQKGRKFTALTGTIGEDQWHVQEYNTPHEQADALARLLLDRGADPNDCQALEHVKFRPNNKWFMLLLEHGLNPKHRLNWQQDDKTEPLTTFDYFLSDAAARGFIDRVRLFLDHGADPNGSVPIDFPHLRRALECGQTEIAALLRKHGARDVALDGEARLRAAVMSGDRQAFEDIRKEDPDLARRFLDQKQALLFEATKENRLAATRLLLELGADSNGGMDRRQRGNRPLHLPCWFGYLDIVKLLVEFGADFNLSSAGADADDANRNSPLGYARNAGQQAVVEYLESLSKQQ
jgi:ankyrin repeat protein